MKTRIVEQVEEILKKAATEEDIAEIQKLIAEVRGKILVGEEEGFWEGKTPCWEVCRCPDMVKNECAAPKYQAVPCWEIEGTYCKLDDYGATGLDTTICQLCRVYKRYGENKPIQIKLFGKGIDTTLRTVNELVEKERAKVK